MVFSLNIKHLEKKGCSIVMMGVMVVMMMMMMVVVDVVVVDVEEPMYFFSTFEIRYTPLSLIFHSP